MQRTTPAAAAIAAAFLASCSFGASAKTLYVTTHGGSVDLPMGHVVTYRLQDALDQVEPGDTVQLLADGDKPAIYQAAEIFRLARGGEAGRPITIRGTIRNGVHLTIVRGGCLEETRPEIAGQPPADQLPPCPSFGAPEETDAAIAAGGSPPRGPGPEEILGGPASAALESSSLEALYSAGVPAAKPAAAPVAVEDQARKSMCFELISASWIVIEDLHLQQCWLPAILIRGGSYITVRNNRITGSSYAIAAFPLAGQAPHHLLVEHNHWIQDVSGPAAETEHCSRQPRRPECAGMMWHRVPFWVTHGGTWEPYNGALFGGKGIMGSVIVRNNVLRNAFNGIRIEGMRCDIREVCLYEDNPCSLEQPCNVNVEIYGNEFFYIRDNPVEIEGWAANWRIHGNSFVNGHSWLSIDGMRGGPVYIFGNTGTFDSIPGTACREGQWHDQKFYDYRGEPRGWIEPREEIVLGCRANSTGKVLKVGGTENEEPIYVFNNSWRLRGALAAGGSIRHLRHWNNAIEFCIDHPYFCPAATPSLGDMSSGVDAGDVRAPADCGHGLVTLYANGRAFFDCVNLPPHADDRTPPSFDFDLTNVEFPPELRGLNQERDGRPRPGEEPSRQLFVDGQGGDFRLISPITGCRITPDERPDLTSGPGWGRLACLPSATHAPVIGAVQGAAGERYRASPYRHWSRSGVSDYPEHPRPVAARWSSTATAIDLSVQFTVPIALAADVVASLPGGASSQPCTLGVDRTLDCRFAALDAAPDPATEIALGAGIIARAAGCAERLPATDWGAEPPQIRIAAPAVQAGQC